MLAQYLLIVVRTILAARVRVVDAVPGRLPESDGHILRPDRQIALHAIVDGPADDPSRLQVKDHSKIQPALNSAKTLDDSCSAEADEVGGFCSTGIECAKVQFVSTARKGATQ